MIKVIFILVSTFKNYYFLNLNKIIKMYLLKTYESC